MIKFLLIFLLLCFPVSTFAGSEGPNNPASSIGDGWSNITGAYADGSLYAGRRIFIMGSGIGQLYNCSFSIPEETILGFIVTSDIYNNPDCTWVGAGINHYLSKDSGSNWGTVESWDVTQTETTRDFGDSANLWGVTDWTHTIVNSATLFRVRLDKKDCIVEGSLILMDDGTTKLIENIIVGDEVEGGLVMGIYSGSVPNYLLFNNNLKVTDWHPVFTLANESVEAKDLVLGDYLITEVGSEEITTIERIHGEIAIYNMTTSSGHFFSDRYKVHNKAEGSCEGLAVWDWRDDWSRVTVYFSGRRRMWIGKLMEWLGIKDQIYFETRDLSGTLIAKGRYPQDWRE